MYIWSIYEYNDHYLSFIFITYCTVTHIINQSQISGGADITKFDLFQSKTIFKTFIICVCVSMCTLTKANISKFFGHDLR